MAICDIVFYNKKYILGLHTPFWHRANRTLDISQVVRANDVMSFVVLPRSLVKPLVTEGWELVARGASQPTT